MKIIVILFVFLISKAMACDVPIATSTMYYTPLALKSCGIWYYGKEPKPKKEKYDEQFYRATDAVCLDFKKDVKIQGSGRYNPKEIYTSTELVIAMHGKNVDSCPTTIGRAENCLLTYISVAADLTKFNLGDIISMPAMKGKKLTMPDGSIFVHPGYFRVDDRGGAIDGAGRFDFYSGTMGLNDKKNSFGIKGSEDTRMFQEKNCEERKKFKRLTPKMPEFSKAVAAIELSQKNIGYHTVSGTGKLSSGNISPTSPSAKSYLFNSENVVLKNGK